MKAISWLVLLSYPLWQVLLHGLFTRLPVAKGMPHQKQALVAIAAGFVSLLGLLVWLERDELSLVKLLAWGGLSVCLSHVYFHAFNLTETARRVRMLLNLRENLPLAPEKGFSPKEVIGRRIERLLALNQLRVENGRYYAKASVLTFTSVILRAYERFLFPERNL